MENNKEKLNVDHESETIIYRQRFLFCLLVVGESVFALFQFFSVFFLFLELLLILKKNFFPILFIIIIIFEFMLFEGPFVFLV